MAMSLNSLLRQAPAPSGAASPPSPTVAEPPTAQGALALAAPADSTGVAVAQPPPARMSIQGMLGGAVSPTGQTGTRGRGVGEGSVRGGGQARVPDLAAPPMRLEDIIKDQVEAAGAPFTGAWHAALGLLADPMFHVLPLETRDRNLEEAERLGWKGAAFWGSWFAGGGAAKLPVALIWKLGTAGAAAGATYAALEGVPALQHGYEDPKTYSRDIATAATFGALTGGALAIAPPIARVAGRAALGTTSTLAKGMNRAIDILPGGAPIRARTQAFVKEAFDKTWHWFGTSGEEVLRKANLGGLADQMKVARSVQALKAGESVAGFFKNFEGLSEEESSRVAWFIEKFDFTDPELYGVASEYTTNKADERLFGVAQREASRMIAFGKMAEKTRMQVYSPEDNEFHRFVLRKNYIPHRLVNPEFYEPGGKHRDQVVHTLMKKTGRTLEQAKEWTDNFAQRIRASNEGVLSGRFPASSSGHYLIGRTMGLPGYETRLDRILPQYYEHFSRRLTNHILFGPEQLTDAVEAGVREAAPGGTLPASSALVSPGPIEYTPPNPKALSDKTAMEIVYARKLQAERSARAAQAIEFKYPRAFAQLEAIPEGEMKNLATSVVRGQFGLLDQPQFGRKALEWLAKTEVITKLALGAISQPSQMLSANVRTGYRNSMRDFFRYLSQDPEVFDFAIRSGVALRGVVRDSQMSLVGRETEFLDKVLFTQFDMASRVYGAMRGASMAEHMGQELMSATHQAERLANVRGVGKAGLNVLGVPKVIQNRIAAIEGRFSKLGIDAREIVEQGGTLNQEQLLKAAQSVSMDVNFWGDALSLPVFYRSPYGRFITQFKSFGFQQTRLIKDHVVKPFMKWVEGKPGGDPAPLTRFLLTMPAGGEAISDLKALARAKDRPTNVIERLADNMANAAGWGLLYDATRATDYGAAGTLGLLTGPIGSTMGKLGAGIGEAKKGRPTTLTRFAIEEGLPLAAYYMAPGAAPLVAAMTPAISNTLLPKKASPSE